MTHKIPFTTKYRRIHCYPWSTESHRTLYAPLAYDNSNISRVSNYQAPSVDDFPAELNYVTASEEVSSEKVNKNEFDTLQDSRLNIGNKITESCGNEDMRARI